MSKLLSGLDLQNGNLVNSVHATLPPAAIAYKVDSSFILALLTPDTNLGELIGLQIEFKRTVDSNFPNLKIYQLYFKQYPGNNNPYFYKKDTGAELTIQHSWPVLVSVGMVEQEELELSCLGESQYIGSIETGFNPQQVYTKLDSYKNDIDLVYFPIEHLIFLTHLYKKLTISGCELNLGRKLAHNQVGNTPQIPYVPCFSLKMEGSGLNSPSVIINLSPTIDEVVGPNIVVGHPCPPAWESFKAVFSARMARYPDQKDKESLLKLLPALWKSWNNPGVVSQPRLP